MGHASLTVTLGTIAVTLGGHAHTEELLVGACWFAESGEDQDRFEGTFRHTQMIIAQSDSWAIHLWGQEFRKYHEDAMRAKEAETIKLKKVNSCGRATSLRLSCCVCFLWLLSTLPTLLTRLSLLCR